MRRLFLHGLIFVLGAVDAASGFADEVGQEILPWTPGTMEIHQISTGRGNAGLYIFPDGTTMLVDAGEIGKKVERHATSLPRMCMRPHSP